MHIRVCKGVFVYIETCLYCLYECICIPFMYCVDVGICMYVNLHMYMNM